MRGFAHLGALQAFYDRSLMEDVKQYIGTSVGTMIGYLLCIGYSPVEILVGIAQDNEMLTTMSPLNIVGGLSGKGVFSFQPFREVLERMTLQKMDSAIPTLSELRQKTNRSLVCCTYNYTKDRLTFLGPDSHPHLSCIDAIQMSSSLPLFFEPFLFENDQYIDGAVIANFPLFYALEQRSSSDKDRNSPDSFPSILGICFTNTSVNPFREKKKEESGKEDTTVNNDHINDGDHKNASSLITTATATHDFPTDSKEPMSNLDFETDIQYDDNSNAKDPSTDKNKKDEEEQNSKRLDDTSFSSSSSPFNLFEFCSKLMFVPSSYLDQILNHPYRGNDSRRSSSNYCNDDQSGSLSSFSLSEERKDDENIHVLEIDSTPHDLSSTFFPFQLSCVQRLEIFSKGYTSATVFIEERIIKK